MRDVDDNVAKQLNAGFAILIKARNEKLRNGESLVEIDKDILEYVKRTYSFEYLRYDLEQGGWR